jgi:hypothetical protein
VNDVHFGETECSRLGVMEEGTARAAPGPGEPTLPGDDEPSASRRSGARPDVVLVKGDYELGTEESTPRSSPRTGRFQRAHHGQPRRDARRVDGLEGAVHDRRRRAARRARHRQPGIERSITAAGHWLDDPGISHRPVLVFGHHHLWNLDATDRSAEYFGINPEDSEAFATVVAGHENIVGYFAGHTHRNRIRRTNRARRVPFVEVSCTKDYPGVWAEYRIYEHGFSQIVRRISAPAALEWTERTRPMFAGLYRAYALGPLDHRCYTETW